MRLIHREELEKAIYSNKHINFLAFVLTPWHALGVDAFIKLKQEEGVSLYGFVCILEHIQAGFVTGRDAFNYKNSNIEVLKYVDGKKEGIIEKIHNNWRTTRALNLNNGKNKIFYILSTVNPKYQWHAFIAMHCKNKRPISVLIDEGLGMYMRNPFEWVTDIWSSNYKLIRKFKYTYEFCVGNNIKKKKLISHDAIEQFTLFNIKSMEINKKVVDSYRKVLADNLVQHKDCDFSYYEDALVINSQPYFDENQIEKDVDIKLIKQICKLCAKRGIKVVLKAHPREKSIERYYDIENCFVDNNFSFSQESIISSLKRKPKLLVGLCSTTLITMRLFYGINTLSVLNCVDSTGVRKKMASDLSKFKKVFGHVVNCPSNIEDFEYYLDKIWK